MMNKKDYLSFEKVSLALCWMVSLFPIFVLTSERIYYGKMHFGYYLEKSEDPIPFWIAAGVISLICWSSWLFRSALIKAFANNK
jgi:hypothetical protein